MRYILFLILITCGGEDSNQRAPVVKKDAPPTEKEKRKPDPEWYPKQTSPEPHAEPECLVPELCNKEFEDPIIIDPKGFPPLPQTQEEPLEEPIEDNPQPESEKPIEEEEEEDILTSNKKHKKCMRKFLKCLKKRKIDFSMCKEDNWDMLCFIDIINSDKKSKKCIKRFRECKVR